MRNHRVAGLVAGVSILTMTALAGCSKQQESQSTTMRDTGDEGGGGAFSTFQGRITDRTGTQPASPVQQTTLPPVALAPAPPSVVVTTVPVEQTARDREFTEVASAPVSTFSTDVDTASYSRMRSALLNGRMPQPDTVRVEEMVNYFRYDLPAPTDPATPFSVVTDVVRSPWHADSLVMRVALRGYDVPRTQRLPANLVFLVDVSGSMDASDRLPRVKKALSGLAQEMGPRDRISIVAYAGSAQVVLEPTADHDEIEAAIAGLTAGGSTAGGDGLTLAYQQARAGFLQDGINRVMIASDGDFNVGASDPASLKALITSERQSGITLTTIGVGESTFGDRTMETLADAGDGNAVFFGDEQDARKALHDELTSTLQTIAKDVKAQVEFNPAVIRSYRLVGYENRRLAEQDFDDDTVDAGDIGAGHQVTALYEITPVTSGIAGRRRYEANRTAPDAPMAAPGTEALFVKLRYKLPQGGPSRLLQRPVSSTTLAQAGSATGDTAFALSVASFGQLLSRSGAIGSFGYADVLQLAGSPSQPERVEFVDLVRRASGWVGNPYPESVRIPVTTPTYAPVPTMVAPQPERSATGYVALVMLLLAGVIGATWYGLRRLSSPAVQPDAPASAPSSKEEPYVSSIRSARAESTDPETDRALSSLLHVCGIAAKAAGSDGDIREEVRAVLDRHLPSYADDYIQSRRRATAARAAELEDGLRRTAELLASRLRSLLDSQSGRDVARMNDHERFLSGRHTPDAMA